MFNNHEYDYVFLEYDMFQGKQFLKEVLYKKIEQKMVVLTESIFCSEDNGCNYCDINYNKIRITKPFVFKNILNVINDWENTVCKKDCIQENDLKMATI
ncbi:MAG: hypothetical protein HXX81_02195 [Campylobacterales bacterium]|nr:hypothetical protein [Campylobacterales bacterium]